MADVLADRSILFVFRIEQGKPWYLLLRRAPEREDAGRWETIVAETHGDEGNARAAVRTLVEMTSLDPQALWVTSHVTTEYDSQVDAVRLSPAFAALVSGEVTLGAVHDTSRWFSANEAANAIRSEARRAALDAVNREIGVPVAAGNDPDPRRRMV